MQEARSRQAEAAADVEFLGDDVHRRFGAVVRVRQHRPQLVESTQDISLFAAVDDVRLLRGRRPLLLVEALRKFHVHDRLRRRRQDAKENQIEYKSQYFSIYIGRVKYL